MHTINPISPEYIEIIADLHLTAFREHVNVRLGKAYAVAFIKWFYDNKDAISLMALNNQQEVLGYVVGAKWGYQKKINRDLFKVAIISIVRRPWVLLDKRITSSLWNRMKVQLGISRHLQETQSELKGNIISLVGISVSDQARGSGVAQFLIQKFEDKSCELGYDIMRLSVYRTNKIARKFYEKEGWEIIPNTASKNVCGYFKKLN